jgi:extradiol dioxygenase family protein
VTGTSSPVPPICATRRTPQAACATMFFLDPCGNALEFKAFADPERLFAK